MTRTFILIGLVFILSNCATKRTTVTGEAHEDLTQKYKGQVGVATKTDFVEEFGSADWCQPKGGGAETCRFVKKMGVKWTGDKLNRKQHELYDEVITDFDSQGILKTFEAKSQR